MSAPDNNATDVITAFEFRMSMSGKERAALRAEAHHLVVQVHVGHQGLTPALLATLDDVLRTHELVKVQVLGGVVVIGPGASSDRAI